MSMLSVVDTESWDIRGMVMANRLELMDGSFVAYSGESPLPVVDGPFDSSGKNIKRIQKKCVKMKNQSQ